MQNQYGHIPQVLNFGAGWEEEKGRKGEEEDEEIEKGVRGEGE